MSGPARRRLSARRPARSLKMIWRVPGGPDMRFHLRVGYEPQNGKVYGWPGEIWLTPGRSAGRYGSMLMWLAHDSAESLSLHLQHGHELIDLRARFKPGSLLRCAVEWAWLESDALGADVPPLPDDLPSDLIGHWRRLRAEDDAALSRSEGGTP